MHKNSIPRTTENVASPEPRLQSFCKSPACGEVLMASLEQAIPAFGDWCVVELCTENEELRAPFVLHRNINELTSIGYEKIVRLNHLWDQVDADYSSCDEGSFLHRLAKDENHLEALTGLNLTSYISVPLVSPRHIWGWLTVFSVQAPAGVDQESISKLKALASSTAAGLDVAADNFSLKEALELKNKFVSMVSHELRAPLNITLGWSALLLDNPELDEETKKTLEIIYRNTREQADIINNLLDTTRIEVGKLALDMKNVHLATFIEQNLQSVSILAKDKGVQLKCQIEAPFARMTADPIRLHQILQNLVVNAIKFTPEGGVVSVQLVEDAKNVQIKVRDNGEGIPKEFLPQVFDRFKQRLGSKSYQPGLGLGLSIVRELAKAHGAEVSAHSDGPGTGATFTVKFPKQPAMHSAPHSENFVH